MKSYKIFFFGLILSVFPAIASAATLSFSPQSATYSAGSQIVVNVYVSSADEPMNAVSGEISFPTNKLSVTSISKGNSIVSLWTADPTFSNSAGTVNFEGIVLNPGFEGNNGKVISITFRALSSGNAKIDFDSGSILANDGVGTSIPTTLGSADFTITGAVPAPPAVQQVIAPAPVTAPVPETTCPTLAPTISQAPTYIIAVGKFKINIFLGMFLIFLLLLLAALFIQRSLIKKHKTKKEVMQTLANANKLANIKFNYFNDYVNAELDRMEKDKKIKAMPGALDAIESIKEHIADYKGFLDKEQK